MKTMKKILTATMALAITATAVIVPAMAETAADSTTDTAAVIVVTGRQGQMPGMGGFPGQSGQLPDLSQTPGTDVQN